MADNQTGWTLPLPGISHRMARKELTPRQSTVRQFIEILGMDNEHIRLELAGH